MFAIFIFILANIISIIIALPALTASVMGDRVSASELYIAVDGKRIHMASDEVYIYSDVEIYGYNLIIKAFENSKFKISNSGTFSAADGIFLIQNNRTVLVEMAGDIVELESGGQYIYLPKYSEILVLSGRAEGSDRIASGGQILRFEIDNYEVFASGRSMIKEYINNDISLFDKISELQIVDVIPPYVNNILPTDGEIINSNTVKFSGEVEIGSQVYIRGIQVNVDGFGFWNTEIPVEDKPELIRIVVIDANGNESVVERRFSY